MIQRNYDGFDINIQWDFLKEIEVLREKIKGRIVEIFKSVLLIDF